MYLAALQPRHDGYFRLSDWSQMPAGEIRLVHVFNIHQKMSVMYTDHLEAVVPRSLVDVRDLPSRGQKMAVTTGLKLMSLGWHPS